MPILVNSSSFTFYSIANNPESQLLLPAPPPPLRNTKFRKMRETLIICSFFITALLISNVISQSDETCSTNLSSINSLQLPFDTTSFSCNSVWGAQGFILRYSNTGPGEWSFVLSAPNQNAYVAIGFSPNGRMVGSSAIAGWPGSNGGVPSIQRYLLNGQTPAQVLVGQTNLQFGNASGAVTAGSRIYLAFQLTNTAQPTNRLIYAIGPSGQLPSGPPNFRLVQHAESIPTVLNYVTGQTQTKGTNTNSLRRSHGILVIISWGILIPIGALVARYMKQLDPIWFYSHAAIQSLGFILGVAGIICGVVLSNRVSTNVVKHKAIGIVIFVIGILQVIALLARPGKESKMRKYWNWYHHGFGRLLILLAAVNIFYGIHISKAGSKWNAGYAIPLVILLITSIILELRVRD